MTESSSEDITFQVYDARRFNQLSQWRRATRMVEVWRRGDLGTALFVIPCSWHGWRQWRFGFLSTQHGEMLFLGPCWVEWGLT